MGGIRVGDVNFQNWASGGMGRALGNDSNLYRSGRSVSLRRVGENDNRGATLVTFALGRLSALLLDRSTQRATNVLTIQEGGADSPSSAILTHIQFDVEVGATRRLLKLRR